MQMYGNAKVMGSEPVEARFFFGLILQLPFLFNNCDDPIFH